MYKKTEVNVDEVKKVYLLLEDLNDFFHQREQYSGVEEFADQNYERIHDCYYKIVWNWLPEDEKEKIQSR